MPELEQQIVKLFPDFVTMAGPLPNVAPPATTSPVPTVDAEAIGASVLGFNPGAIDRKDLLAALKAAIPLAKKVDGKPATTVAPVDPVPDLAVGPLATVIVATQMLGTHVAKLEIRPLDPRAERCGADKIVTLIRANIVSLQHALARPGRQSARLVNHSLGTLCGYHPDHCEPFDLHDVRGYFGDLREQAGLSLKNACTAEQEKMLTHFRTAVQLAWIVVQTWEQERKAMYGEKFLGVSIYELRRLFWAIGANLQRLWPLIPPAAWATTSLPVDPPVLAVDFWRWCTQVVTKDAPAQLEQIGRPSFFAIRSAMDETHTVLLEGFIHGTKQKRGAKYVAGDDCKQLPAPFHTPEVEEIVREMLCAVERVREIVSDRDDPRHHPRIDRDLNGVDESTQPTA